MAVYRVAKMTSKRQLTIPEGALAELDHPSHFRVQVHEGVMLLYPGRVMTEREIAREARRMVDRGQVKPRTDGGGRQG